MHGTKTLQHLLQTHFPNATELKATQYNPNRYVTAQQVHDWRPDWITISKLQLAFKGFHSKKIPWAGWNKTSCTETFPREYVTNYAKTI